MIEVPSDQNLPSMYVYQTSQADEHQSGSCNITNGGCCGVDIQESSRRHAVHDANDALVNDVRRSIFFNRSHMAYQTLHSVYKCRFVSNRRYQNLRDIARFCFLSSEIGLAIELEQEWYDERLLYAE